MKKTGELDIKGTVVRAVKINGKDFVCLTDMAERIRGATSPSSKCASSPKSKGESF